MYNPTAKTEPPSLDLLATVGGLLRLAPQSQTAHHIKTLTLFPFLRSSGGGSCRSFSTRVLPRLYNLYVRSSFIFKAQTQ